MEQARSWAKAVSRTAPGDALKQAQREVAGLVRTARFQALVSALSPHLLRRHRMRGTEVEAILEQASQAFAKQVEKGLRLPDGLTNKTGAVAQHHDAQHESAGIATNAHGIRGK